MHSRINPSYISGFKSSVHSLCIENGWHVPFNNDTDSVDLWATVGNVSVFHPCLCTLTLWAKFSIKAI